MTVTTESPMATVTPIFDELAERLGLVWDVDTTDLDSTDLAAADFDTTDSVTTDSVTTEEPVEEPTEADAEAAAG